VPLTSVKRCCLLLPCLFAGAALSQSLSSSFRAPSPEARAVAFLAKEVPAWSRDNRCFSCHNNGDAARALYAACSRGYKFDADSLAATTDWLKQPNRWDDNKGDPGFSDKRLADVQFAAALLAAMEARAVQKGPLSVAAQRLVRCQAKDGSWPVDKGAAAGSPATYGTELATALALRALRKADEPDQRAAIKRAESWLAKARLTSVPAASAMLFGGVKNRRDDSVAYLRNAQTGDGGWGPFADTPPEPFDTALAMLALSEVKDQAGVREIVNRGRSYLVKLQQHDGGWPATTRPPGGESYAQRVSTSGWVTLALLRL
jgi:hypothetical protein